MAGSPFLSTGADNRRMCILCNEYVKDKDDISNVTLAGLQSLQTLAGRWVSVDQSTCSRTPYTEFRLAANRLSCHCTNMCVHDSCRITFRTRIKRRETQSSSPTPEPPSSKSASESSDIDIAPYRIRRGSMQKGVCFVCDLETSNDSKQYNNRGLGRCSEENKTFNGLKNR
jgi:hypothetical protein